MLRKHWRLNRDKTPNKEDFLNNLDEMIQLELAQADIFAQIISLMEKYEDKQHLVTCQQIHEDELLHARKLQEIRALL